MLGKDHSLTWTRESIPLHYKIPANKWVAKFSLGGFSIIWNIMTGTMLVYPTPLIHLSTLESYYTHVQFSNR